MGVAVIQLWCINLRHNTKLFFTSLSYNGHSQVVIIFDRIYNTYNFCIFFAYILNILSSNSPLQYSCQENPTDRGDW